MEDPKTHAWRTPRAFFELPVELQPQCRYYWVCPNHGPMALLGRVESGPSGQEESAEDTFSWSFSPPKFHESFDGVLSSEGAFEIRRRFWRLLHHARQGLKRLELRPEWRLHVELGLTHERAWCVVHGTASAEDNMLRICVGASEMSPTEVLVLHGTWVPSVPSIGADLREALQSALLTLQHKEAWDPDTPQMLLEGWQFTLPEGWRDMTDYAFATADGSLRFRVDDHFGCRSQKAGTLATRMGTKGKHLGPLNSIELESPPPWDHHAFELNLRGALRVATVVLMPMPRCGLVLTAIAQGNSDEDAPRLLESALQSLEIRGFETEKTHD